MEEEAIERRTKLHLEGNLYVIERTIKRSEVSLCILCDIVMFARCNSKLTVTTFLMKHMICQRKKSSIDDRKMSVSVSGVGWVICAPEWTTILPPPKVLRCPMPLYHPHFCCPLSILPGMVCPFRH